MRRWTLGILLALTFNATLRAGTIDDLKRACHRANLGAGKHWLEECIEELVTLEPIHPTFHTIGPDTGPGFGFGTGYIWRRGEFEYQPSITEVVSTNGSEEVQGSFTFAFPPLSLIKLPSQNDSDDQNGLSLVANALNIPSKASVTVRASWFDAKGQHFYGVGPSTSLSNVGVYDLRETSAGITSNDPITSWAEIGFSADFIGPSITSSGSPSIQQVYSSQTAPGLGRNLDFMRYEPYAQIQFDIPRYRLSFPVLGVSYDFYQDLDGPNFSFQRLNATAEAEYGILLPSVGTASHRSGLKNFLCPPTRGARHCTAGSISLLATVAAARIGANSEVPFYLQETLGGIDRDGMDTLRGFVDNRFTAPSRVLFQAEYRHPIWGPIGLLTFYDTGTVAQDVSDLNMDRLHHDIGVGFTVSATKRVVMRFYMGFDTGEPVQMPGVKFGPIVQ